MKNCSENTSESGLVKHELDTSMVCGRFSFISRVINRLLRLDALNGIYRTAMEQDSGKPFVDRVLETLGTGCSITEGDRLRVPRDGPAIVVANHPFGGLEGMILASIMLSVRPDVKIMANHFLRCIKADEFREMCVFVDPFGSGKSARNNFKPLREAVRWVRDGGMLGVFPAGTVSHLQLGKGLIADPEWSSTVAGIIRMTGAQVLPIFFDGSNSLLFHLLGLMHPFLRTLRLPREMLNKRNKTINVRIGKTIGHGRLERFPDDSSMMKYLRLKTYMLKPGHKWSGPGNPSTATPESGNRMHPVVAPQPRDCLKSDILALPLGQVLVDAGRFTVYQAEAGQIPHVLQEIGRLREITFRDAREGTGNPVDLDCHDIFYTHLFLWNKEREEIVGGYRLGLTDDILSRFGKKALYTTTLFDYRNGFFERLGPAIELGRSFVRPEYQKDYQPLMLLWKGIGRFVSTRPVFKTLFGPVSISNSYHSISRKLIVAFSKQSDNTSDLSLMVKGKHPLRARRFTRRETFNTARSLVDDIQDLSEMISDIEDDQKGIPILLKHYMKLGGEFLAFSVDPDFSDVMDALIAVDLTRTDPRVLERYMGKDAAVAFLRHHRRVAVENCA